MRPVWHLILPGFLSLMASSAAIAAIPGADPDWPCQQRLVPQVTASTFWSDPSISSPPISTARWEDDDKLSDLVLSVTSRDISDDEGEAKIHAYAKKLKPAQRKTLLPEAFIGIVERTNDERGEIINRIKELTQRQRGVAQQSAKLNASVEAIPADAQGSKADERAQDVQERDLTIRTFQETERTMRYACEVPAQLDQRLGRYAKALQSHLAP